MHNVDKESGTNEGNNLQVFRARKGEKKQENGMDSKGHCAIKMSLILRLPT